MHGLDRRDDLVGRGMLQQVAVGAGGEGVHDPAAIAVGREHEHTGAGVVGGDAPGGLEAVHARHRQIHQHDVGLVLGYRRQRRLAVRSRGNDLHAVSGGEQLLEARAHDDVVVDDEDPDHGCHTFSSGNVTVTSVPRPGAERTAVLPPASATRPERARRPTCPSAMRRLMSAVEKPRPLSRTVNVTEPSTDCTDTWTLVAAAWAATLRTASCALRYSSVVVATGSARSSTPTSRWVVMPRPFSRLSRPLSPTWRPSSWGLAG